MVLAGVKKREGWLLSRWELIYPVSWKDLCKAVYSLYPSYEAPEILVDGEKTGISSREDILKLSEKSSISVRGISKVIGIPLMIRFFDGKKDVDVSAAAANKEFSEADYEKFNKALCSFMDSVEIAMYR